MSEKGLLAINPIKFVNMYYTGFMGKDRLKIDYKLTKLLTQNVLYSAYHNVKSISEIADSIGVNINLIREEIEYLEDNGFMEKVADEKYQTNIFISDFSKEVCEKRHSIYSKYATIICDTYIPMIIKEAWNIFQNAVKDSIEKNHEPCIITPQKDLNVLLWSVITFALCKKFQNPEYNESIIKHFVKRCDDSENIYFASIKNDYDLSYDEAQYESNGEMDIAFGPDDVYNLSVWLYNTNFDSRKENFGQILLHKYSFLYDYITGRVLYNNDNHDRFDELLTSGLLLSQKPDNSTQNTPLFNLNTIVSTISKDDFLAILPNVPDEILGLNKKLSEEIYEISKSQYPSHKQDLCYEICRNCIESNDIKTRILGSLLTNGILKPLNDIQKKTVNTIMFCENL
ncbi:MAG: hypothetical protein FWG98_03685 [Candidatus Cloacimonetes bacterium]|nr:hypothetical protein [Candidatus Cloacimonadota bacterium]